MSCSKLTRRRWSEEDFIINGSRARLLSDLMAEDPTLLTDWASLKDCFVLEEDHRFEVNGLLMANGARIREILLRTLLLWIQEMQDKQNKATFNNCLNILAAHQLYKTVEILLKNERFIRLGKDLVYLVEGQWYDRNGLCNGVPNSCMMATVEDEMMCDVIQEQCITRDWILIKQAQNGNQSLYYVKDHPLAPGKTAKNYAPERDMRIQFDSIVISQIRRDKSRSLGGVLPAWIFNGYSAHYFIPHNNVIVQWVDPRWNKAQMAGRWNNRSIEIMMLTDENQEASSSQIARIGQICQSLSPSFGFNINIKYLGSHQEAQGSGYEGMVANVQTIRDLLGLDKLPV